MSPEREQADDTQGPLTALAASSKGCAASLHTGMMTIGVHRIALAQIHTCAHKEPVSPAQHGNTLSAGNANRPRLSLSTITEDFENTSLTATKGGTDTVSSNLDHSAMFEKCDEDTQGRCVATHVHLGWRLTRS